MILRDDEGEFVEYRSLIQKKKSGMTADEGET